LPLPFPLPWAAIDVKMNRLKARIDSNLFIRAIPLVDEDKDITKIAILGPLLQ
jgi:hypothetical protein